MSGRSGQGVLQSDFFSTAAKVPRRDSPSAPQLPAGTSTPVTLESLRQLAQSMGLGASAAGSAGGTGGKKKAGGKKKKGKAKKKTGKGKGKNAAASLDAPTTDDPHSSGATDGVAAGTTEQGLAQPSGSGHSAPSVANFVATGPGDEFAAAARRELRRASQRVEAMAIPRLECGCVRRAALGQQFIVHHCGMDKIRVPGRRDMSAQRAPVLGGEAVAARAVDLTVASDFGMESPHSTVLLTQDMATQMVLKYTLVLENLEVLLPEHAEVFCRRATLLHILQCFEDARMDAVHALELDHDYPAAHFRLGMALFALARYTSAADAFRAGLEVAPDDKYLLSAWRTATKECTRRRHRVGHRQRLLPNTPLRTVGKSREAQTPINSVGLPILPKRMSSRNLLVPSDNDSGDSESGEDRLRPLVSTQAGATPVYETTFRAFG